MSPLARDRASELMQASGVDALILFQPENFTYAVGAPPGMETSWRRGGATAVVVPADPAEPIAAVMGDLQSAPVRQAVPGLDLRLHRIWIDTVDIRFVSQEGLTTPEIVAAGYREGERSGSPNRQRPTTLNIPEAMGLVSDILREKGLTGCRVGADLEFLPVADFERIRPLVPEVKEWIDGSGIVKRLRMIKSPTEITYLRTANSLSQAGYRHATALVEIGQSRRELSDNFRAGVLAAVADLKEPKFNWCSDFSSIGDDPWSTEGNVFEGAILKIDANCNVAGYIADSARSYSFGKPPRLAIDVYSALSEAYVLGLDTIRPGNRLADVYETTVQSMRKAGYHGYRRGHFGHGLGASVGAEEWPFIAADSDVVIEAGMVLAFETPFYAKGIGALTIEDQILVTETGIDVMTSMPRELIDLS